MLPHLQARVALIFQTLDQLVVSVTPLSVDVNAFKLKIELSDGSNLRLSESYRADALEKYAYYWLDDQNKLIIGWDNAPHHTRLSTYPHHKHVAAQANVQPSAETDLEAILNVIRDTLVAKNV